MSTIEAATGLFYFFSQYFHVYPPKPNLDKIKQLKMLEKALTRKKKIDARRPETEDFLFYRIESLNKNNGSIMLKSQVRRSDQYKPIKIRVAIMRNICWA